MADFTVDPRNWDSCWCPVCSEMVTPLIEGEDIKLYCPRCMSELSKGV